MDTERNPDSGPRPATGGRLTMDCYDLQMKLPVVEKYDVIVAGGGVAGVAAATTAAELGKSVLLLEKSNILGGLGTLGLVNLFVPMCNGDGKQIIFGKADQWMRQSMEVGFQSVPKPWTGDDPQGRKQHRLEQQYSTYMFALYLLETVLASGVHLLYDCAAVYPVMEGNRCTGVITDSKSGLELYRCEVMIDTTGDADVLRRSGMPTVPGENYYSYFCKMITIESCLEAVEKKDIRYAYRTNSGGNINLFGDDQPEDMPRWSGLTVEEVTDYLVTNQKVLFSNMMKLPKNSRDIAQMPLMPNLRTTCHIRGDYSLQVKDCYRHFEDSVCAINDFSHSYYLFEVPYRTLTNRDYPNMITAGRSADGTGYGWDLLRVIPPAILTGQAAGTAASLALDEGKTLQEIEIRKLQQSLERQNVMIHFPDGYVPEDRSVIIHGRPLREKDAE